MQISAVVARISLARPIATCRNIAFITIKKCDIPLFRTYVSLLCLGLFLPSYTSGKIPRGSDDDAGDSSRVHRPEYIHTSFLGSASDARGKICRENKNTQFNCLQIFYVFFSVKIIWPKSASRIPQATACR